MVTLASYLAVDDVGRVVNHAAVEGQIHGGVAQGVGQALMEHAAYDGTGQPASASFMDYALPRAVDLPFVLAEEIDGVPSATNVLGAKGAGEGGTTGALGAMLNAINDALASAGAGPVGLPATPQRIWQALRVSKRLEHPRRTAEKTARETGPA
jgi:aerobic carbon-monoxide dehydrogenase large subunit